MSADQLAAFIEKVKSDTELQEKLQATTSPDVVVEIASAAGFSITSEDIQSIKTESSELSDGDLEGASGGVQSLAAFCFNF